ncbi:hypothetical protein NVM02_000762 [Salmonella enterica]|nr:hypothetical protein [Salmonella enterica subsp. enterica serovar Typhimurium]EEC5061051.1 hypothetical protein [Salmonella enterica subsp. enterica serovar Enteritidis]EJO9563721.1 hypothetical protein [Salmonella enterica]EJO9815080.1 hypothetical protein [Salmonella enterica]EJP1054230.1 hypothetical protein [Salmonella enterica]
MWLSAIHRDLPKREVTLSVDAEPITVGVANFDRMEEGQYVVVDDKENEFMLFHPEVDTTDIKDGVWLASWQDKETEKWMWAIAKQTGPTSFVLDTNHHVEPIPH